MTFSSNYREVRKIGTQLHSFYKEQPNRTQLPYPYCKKNCKALTISRESTVLLVYITNTMHASLASRVATRSKFKGL